MHGIVHGLFPFVAWTPWMRVLEKLSWQDLWRMDQVGVVEYLTGWVPCSDESGGMVKVPHPRSMVEAAARYCSDVGNETV